jgi:glycosyltransferase involved in cell wall biosynthesis
VIRLAVRVRNRLRHLARRSRDVARDQRRWRAILRTPPAAGTLRVSYGYDRLPGPDEVAFGGLVKFRLLADALPNAPRDFNALYLGSSSLPLDARTLVRIARRRGASFFWNQNGTAYPGWFGPGYERINRPRARLLHAADHVFFQSAFCKVSSDRFLGERTGPWEILHNPVDTQWFVPAPARPARPPTLLLGGNQYQRYRFETALQTLAALPDARLVVTGALSWSEEAPAEGRELARLLGVDDRLELTGPYSYRAAPDALRRGDILLHTKYNDPCPSIVLEAMACGLPVVYSASGGVPELVGDDAGVGVPAPLDWERDHPPAAVELADAVRTVAARLEDYAAAARDRSLHFDLAPWVERHRAVFEHYRNAAD